MAIVLTGVIAAVVSVFIVRPIQGYLSSVARGEMVDAADQALRLMARELHLALPNSVRVSADGQTLELIPVTAAGRYFSQDASQRLDFGVNDGSFALMSPSVNLVNGQDLVFYNLGTGVTESDAYAANDTAGAAAVSNRRQYTGSTGTVVSGGNITMAATALPLAALAPPYRFQAIGAPVSYRCAPGASAPFGSLTRYTGYGVQASQPTAFATGTSAVVAANVSACSFSYEADAIAARAGLVSLRLELATTTSYGGPERMFLYHAVHVDNLP